jgi:hypothetical protein
MEVVCRACASAACVRAGHLCQRGRRQSRVELGRFVGSMGSTGRAWEVGLSGLRHYDWLVEASEEQWRTLGWDGPRGFCRGVGIMARTMLGPAEGILEGLSRNLGEWYMWLKPGCGGHGAYDAGAS